IHSLSPSPHGSAGGFGLFGSASPQYSKTALASMSPLSPYLNVDPRYLTHTGEIRWILNMVTRQALLYSAFGVIFEKARGAEDDLNTIAAGTLTGVLYKSPGRSCIICLEHCVIFKMQKKKTHFVSRLKGKMCTSFSVVDLFEEKREIALKTIIRQDLLQKTFFNFYQILVNKINRCYIMLNTWLTNM
uniref:Uncharacterized protein n=1 Tax=Sinocyclocheilus rhinocerous TaxID=307959 RepID=A0A673MN24_9TELE